MAIDVLLAVLSLLMMLGVFTAFVDRGSVEVRRGLQYVMCDLAGTKFARVESLLRLSGLGNEPGETYELEIASGEGEVSPAELIAKYNENNVEVTIKYTGTEIICLGRRVPGWR